MSPQPQNKEASVSHIESLCHLSTGVAAELPGAAAEEKITPNGEALLDEAATKTLIRKIDVKLIPPLAFLYALALIDRSNLPNFFVPYILFEFPANLMMRKIGPAAWLGSIGFGWGILTIFMGLCHTWGTLLVCRIIFGALEAGLFPGCIYLMSCWYKRYEVQKRFSWFYVVGLLSNGLGSLLAYGIQHMHGLAGFKGWRWIFIIEGIASCVVGVIAFMVLIDFPDRASHRGRLRRRPFLSESEAAIVLSRIAQDRGDALPEKLTFETLTKFLRDWKIWEFGILIGCNNAVVYSFSFFLPLILKGALGYSVKKTYILLFPPSVLGVLWMLFTAWLGDKYRNRGLLIITNSCLSILGMSMMAWLTDPTARYIGAFIGVAVTQSNIPAVFSYQHNNIVGQMKRAFATAIMVGCGGCGGIVAANVFRQQDAPAYLTGMMVVITSQALTVVLVAKNFIVFRRQNQRAEHGKIVIEETPGFKYTY